MSSRYSSPINEHTVKVLAEIKDFLSIIDSKVDDQQHAFDVLDQAVEMNLWVQLKVMNDGISFEGDAEKLVRHVRNLQQEYLAIVAISNFLRALS